MGQIEDVRLALEEKDSKVRPLLVLDGLSSNVQENLDLLKMIIPKVHKKNFKKLTVLGFPLVLNGGNTLIFFCPFPCTFRVEVVMSSLPPQSISQGSLRWKLSPWRRKRPGRYEKKKYLSYLCLRVWGEIFRVWGNQSDSFHFF